MISLWKTVTDLDRLNDLQRVAIDCYALAVASTGQYAVEADRDQATAFRERLQALEKALRTDATIQSLQTVSESYRGELRDYRDQAQKRIDRMRQEVAAATGAMKAFADSVASNSADHEEHVEKELHTLQGLTKTDDLAKIHGGIQTATQGIASSMSQMRRSNQMVIAQLQDEIRLLHQEIQAERRAVQTERVSGSWDRQKLEARTKELLHNDESFCLLLAGLLNFRQINRQYTQAVTEAALKAVLKRFQQTLGEDVMIGRWNEDQFAAILTIAPSNVMALSREVTSKLSGDYPVLSETVAIRVTAGIVDRRAGDDPAKFHKKLEQISGALSRG